MSRIGRVTRDRVDAYIGVDIGTTSTRAIAFSETGSLIVKVAVPTSVRYGPGARAVVDPTVVWSQVAEAMRQIRRRGVRPVGIGVTSQLGLVLVDDQGRPTADAMLWADRRAVSQARSLARELGPDSITLGGRRVTPESPAAKLLWMRSHDLDALERTRWVLSLKDYVVARMTGRFVTDHTHASYSLLFDVSARVWSDRLVEAARLSSHLLPSLRTASDAAGTLTYEAAAETGSPRGTVVAVGAPDATLGALGAGATRPGVTVDIAGSTDVLLHTVACPIPDPDGRFVLNAYVLPEAWVIGGPTGLTGGAVTWLARLLRFPSVGDMYAALERDLVALLSDRRGLAFRTALTGERYPYWDLLHAGRIVGLRPEHGPADLIRAAEEGGAFLVATGVDVLRQAGAAIEEVIVVGGVAARPGALQLRADVLGCRISTVAEQESTALGAAMVAAIARGQYGSVEDAARAMVRSGPSYEPIRDTQHQLDSAYRAWRAAGASSRRGRGAARRQSEGGAG